MAYHKIDWEMISYRFKRVSNQPEIEECYNLAPVIKNLRDNADLLNAFFIDNEK